MQSYPLRVRGLKRDQLDNRLIEIDVVSFTGTWIETCKSN